MILGQLIIVEGADCTGKTSLARYISRLLDAVYIHATGHKSLHPAMEAYHKSLFQVARDSLERGQDVVMDRFWPSETCYGEVLREEVHRKSGYHASEFFALCQGLNAQYIFCFSENAGDRQISAPDNDHPYSRENYNKVYLKYQELYARLALDEVDVYDYCIERDGNDLAKYCAKIGIT